MSDEVVRIGVSAARAARLKGPRIEDPETDEARAARHAADREAFFKKSIEADFAEPFWPIERTLLWIGLRDRNMIRSRLSEIKRSWYGGEQLFPSPRTQLLTAGRNGSIKAIGHSGESLLPGSFFFLDEDSLLEKDIRYERGSVLSSFPECHSEPSIEKDAEEAEQKFLTPSATRKSRRGRPVELPWSLIRKEVFRLMDEHGAINDENPSWNTQIKVEDKISDFINVNFSEHKKVAEDGGPSKSSLQGHVSKYIKEWESNNTH